MSQLTDFAENKLVDMMRQVAWSLPASLYFGLASAAADGSITELSGTDYARVALTRNLTNWSGTQGAGTTTASNGTSHISSNNVVIDFGTAGSNWGTANYLSVHDASSAGNVIAYVPFSVPISIVTSDPVNIAIGAVQFTLGLTGGCSDYLANKLIDFILRGQAFSFPATLYIAACTSAPNNAGGGTEPAVGGYARVAYTASVTSLAATNGAGTTTNPSSGTSGETSNNNQITFPTPTANYPAAITHRKIMDAASGGNMLLYATLSAPKTIVSGGTPLFYAPGNMVIRFA